DPATARRGSTIASYQTTGTDDDLLIPSAGNPFRRNAAPPSSDEMPRTFATVDRPDTMLQNIDRQIASVQEDLAPKITVGPAFRSRTGTSGLDQLNEISSAMSLEAHPFERGRLTFGVTPTFLSAGDVPGDTASQRLFGTIAVNGGVAPSNQSAQGVGL